MFPLRLAVLASLLVLPVRAYPGSVHHIRIDGVINPVSAKFIMQSLERAESAGAQALLIELDTPGGLLEATRDIVQAFLASKIPVIVYVSPSGARAGSAGVFITLAAHIAAMAPGTNIGAAHPVTIGGGGLPGSGQPDSSQQSTMSEKMTNDAAAMIRSIAEERGRNINWADSSVRTSESITATDALKRNVIDLIAADIDTLLALANGRKVKLSGLEHVLNTENADILFFEMDWREKLFDQLSDPNIAYIFMMLGIYGIIFELSNPGAVLPGIVGGICLLLAFFAFQTLPLNAVGVLLILFGVTLLLLEIKIPSYGALTIGGAISLALGSIMLIDASLPALRVSISVIVPTVIATVLFAMFAVGMGLRAQTRKVTTGQEGLVGQTGEALEDLDPKGKILVSGEYWNAKAKGSKSPISKGSSVRVESVENMLLTVVAVPESDV